MTGHTVELYPIILKFLVDTLKNVPKVILLTFFTVCETSGVKVTYWCRSLNAVENIKNTFLKLSYYSLS